MALRIVTLASDTRYVTKALRREATARLRCRLAMLPLPHIAAILITATVTTHIYHWPMSRFRQLLPSACSRHEVTSSRQPLLSRHTTGQPPIAATRVAASRRRYARHGYTYVIAATLLFHAVIRCYAHCFSQRYIDTPPYSAAELPLLAHITYILALCCLLMRH